MEQNGGVEREKQASPPKTPNRDRSRSPRQLKCRGQKIFLSNIPYKMTWEKLKDLVKEEVGYTGFVDMVELNGKSIGMATVKFNTPEVATLALNKLHKFKIGDRHLIAREETARDRERMEQFKSSTNTDELIELLNFMSPHILQHLGFDGHVTDAVHVSNVDYHTSWQDIKDLFRLAGNVIKADMRQDADGKPRGFGIVKFSAPYEAVQAISMFNNQLFRGRSLRMKIDRDGNPPRPIARERLLEVEDQARELLPIILRQVTSGATINVKDLAQTVRTRSIPDGCSVVGSGFGSLGFPLRSGQDIGLWIQDLLREQSSGRPLAYDMHRTVHDGFLSPDSGLQSILSAAMRGGMKEGEVLRFASSIGMPKLFPSPLDTGSRMRSSSFDHVLARYNSPTRGRRTERSFRGKSVSHGGGKASSSNATNGNGTNAHESKSSVIVKNIPYSYDEEALQESFGEVGSVMKVEVQRDVNSRPLGRALIDFVNVADAEKAVATMNGIRFDGRAITVEHC